MQTSCHFIYRGPGRVVISRGTPRGLGAGYKVFRDLAPSRETLRLETVEEYEPRFMAELARLDPQATWDRLHALFPDGSEPVLLCFERPPLTRSNFCHRRMVAKWFKDTLGHDVPEWTPEDRKGPLGL